MTAMHWLALTCGAGLFAIVGALWHIGTAIHQLADEVAANTDAHTRRHDEERT